MTSLWVWLWACNDALVTDHLPHNLHSGKLKELTEQTEQSPWACDRPEKAGPRQPGLNEHISHGASR